LSEYTREEILKLIEENGGPEGLDLSGKDLSGVNLSREKIVEELERAREKTPYETPVWYSDWRGGGINLHGANLQGAILNRAKLQGACLWGADLKGAKLQGAVLKEALLGAVILKDAHLEGANLEKAYLGDTELQGADLSFVKLYEAHLRGANLRGAHLESSHLEKVDFFAAKSLKGAYFHNVFLDNTRMRKEQLDKEIGEERTGKYDLAKEAYLALKNNFAEIGCYRDESWAYIKERQMGKMCSAPWRARRFYGKSQLSDSWGSKLPAWHPRVWWFYVRHTWKWFWDWVAEVTCKYGESIFRTLGTMGVALVGFAVLYRLLGAVVDMSGNSSSSWLHCLLYSGGAFTTFGVDTLRLTNDWIRALSIFESGVGIALTGLLGFVLGNRIRRS
jgi:uncharacterized protein YjbI with pentapeptide repeats